MRRHSTRCFLVVLFVLSILCLATNTRDYRAGSLAKEEPQAIYAADPHDSWNRIFYLLFTRTVELRLTDDFKGEGRFDSTISVMGNSSLAVTSRTFERIESGDRAIDPLYPNFFNSKGAESLLVDPRFTEFKQALTEACAETVPRSALHRALMQADVWAAYDVMFWESDMRGPIGDHARELVPLLDQFIGKLALTSQEISALPRNYLTAQAHLNLPDLFNESSGWMEVEWSADREHDAMVGHRRSARVFLKPATDPRKFLADVNQRIRKRQDPLPGGIGALNGTALTTQVLLIDRSGRVVPSPLIYEMQFRVPLKDGQGAFKTTRVEEYDLSRKALLNDPSSGGFIRHDAEDPAYLPASGNDFTFASPTIGQKETGPPILGTLHRRCESCHFETSVFTFLLIQIPGRPRLPVRQLRSSADQHAAFVAEEKTKEPRFKSLHPAN
jgi:hypothetical protein